MLVSSEISKKLKPFASYLPLIFSLSIIGYFSFKGASLAFLNHPDGVYEYHNARNLFYYGTLESGPIINQLLNAIGFAILGVNYHVILYLQALYNVIIAGLIFLIVNDKIDNKIIAGIIPLGYLRMVYFFYVGPVNGKQYPLFMSLLLLSLYFLIKADKSELSPKRKAFFAISAFFLSLGFMTHILITFSLLIPFSYFMKRVYHLVKGQEQKFQKIKHAIVSRDSVFVEGMIYLGILLVFIIPYLAWRIYSSNWNQFYEYPVSWGIHKYGRYVNEAIWNHPDPFSSSYYWIAEYNMLHYHLLLPEILFLFLLGTFILIKKPSNNNSFRFIVFITMFSVLIPFLAGRVPPGPVYLFAFFPMSLVISGIGLQYLFDLFENNNSFYKIQWISLLLIVVIFLSSIPYHYAHYQSQYEIVDAEIEDFNHIKAILPEKTRIAFRDYSPEVFLIKADVLTFTKDFLEEDTVQFLNWTSETIVANIMKKYQIDYIFIHVETKWESEYYNAWTLPFYGFTTRHFIEIYNSQQFVKVLDGNKLDVFEVNQTHQDYLINEGF